MEPNAAVGCPFDTGDFQRIMECSAERGDGIPVPARAGEQRCVREQWPEALFCSGAALNYALDKIRCERHYPRFVELTVTDMQGADIEIEVFLGKPQEFSGSQPGKIEEAQRGAEDSSTYGRSLPRRQLSTGLQEPPAFVSIEHAWHKLLRHDP